MTVEAAPTEGDLPDRARVVVIGGGVIGTSTAYHLARRGWTDVVLLEQGQLSSGTTWHAAGLLGQLRATESGTRLVQYSARLYGELEAETGLATGIKRCGGVGQNLGIKFQKDMFCRHFASSVLTTHEVIR